jgi:hypothetical protein
VSEWSLVTILVNRVTKEDIMSAVTASSPPYTPALGLGDRDTVYHVDRDHEPKWSWTWTLMEALAYAASETRSCAVAAREGTRIAAGQPLSLAISLAIR